MQNQKTNTHMASDLVGQSSEEDPGASRRKKFSTRGRLEKIKQIQSYVDQGFSIKAAVQKVGISEQTYYNWKKKDKPESALDDLAKLEAENMELKKLLAEKLREENRILKKRIMGVSGK